jgi:threonine aldolase
VETNIIIFEVKERFTARELSAKLKEQGILAIPISPKQIRMVVHLDISAERCQRTIDVLQAL